MIDDALVHAELVQLHDAPFSALHVKGYKAVPQINDASVTGLKIGNDWYDVHPGTFQIVSAGFPAGAQWKKFGEPGGQWFCACLHDIQLIRSTEGWAAAGQGDPNVGV